MMRRHNKGYVLWLILALVQGGAQLIAGCAATKNVQAAENDRAVATAQNGGTDSEQSSHINLPVRLSRAFFEKPLKASLELSQVSSGKKQNFESRVDWRELPTTLPPPSGDVIGDFRDRQGEASFHDLNAPMQMLFHIIPDVSSVGLSRDDVVVSGWQDLSVDDRALKDALNQTQTFELVGAEKFPNAVRLVFADTATGDLRLVVRLEQ